MDPASRQPLLVLLEGPSDVAALEAVLARCGPAGAGAGTATGADLTGAAPAYRLVDMGGVTNTAAHLRAARREGAGTWPAVLGLCDAGEAWVVVRALRGAGLPVADVADLGAHGFWVCDRDLEEELVRALGAQRCLAVLDAVELGRRFRAFSAQRAWVDRPVEERLRRFCGVASGRKTLLARAMAGALAPAELPPPIAELVRAIGAGTAWAGGSAGTAHAGAQECPP